VCLRVASRGMHWSAPIITRNMMTTMKNMKRPRADVSDVSEVSDVSVVPALESVVTDEEQQPQINM